MISLGGFGFAEYKQEGEWWEGGRKQGISFSIIQWPNVLVQSKSMGDRSSAKSVASKCASLSESGFSSVTQSVLLGKD